MAPRYFAAHTNDSGSLILSSLSAPLNSYDKVIDLWAQRRSRGYPERAGQPRVLLDLGSITDLAEPEFGQLLMTDPVISSVFEWGRRVGHQDKERMRK